MLTCLATAALGSPKRLASALVRTASLSCVLILDPCCPSTVCCQEPTTAFLAITVASSLCSCN